MRGKPMDPFARKMVQASLAYGLALIAMFAVLTGFYIHIRPPCSDAVVSESSSPDGRWIAATMERRCGTESEFLTHVNLRPASEALRPGFFTGKVSEGEVLMLETDAQSAGLTLTWRNPADLQISCAACKDVAVLNKQASLDGIRVEYHPASSSPNRSAR